MTQRTGPGTLGHVCARLRHLRAYTHERHAIISENLEGTLPIPSILPFLLDLLFFRYASYILPHSIDPFRYPSSILPSGSVFYRSIPISLQYPSHWICIL